MAGAALPLVAASFALLSGLSTEVSPSGSWSWDDTLKAVLVVAAIGVIAGSALFAMFGSWGPERSGWFKLFVVLGIAGAYLASAAASFVLAFVVSFTRDPPEC
ncbi:MAG: hypothetical protein KJN63_00540 [Acidimicrobiia bacterium]|nr:hypothetical protein [Acidimicrobiia bacterium]